MFGRVIIFKIRQPLRCISRVIYQLVLICGTTERRKTIAPVQKILAVPAQENTGKHSLI